MVSARDVAIVLQRVIVPLAVVLLLLTALYLAADAEGLGQRYARYYPYVFMSAAAALMVLLGAIARRLWRLHRRVRRGEPGAALTRRLLLVTLLLAVPPLLLVYGFGLRFVGATVDTWFKVNSESALNSALALGRIHVDERLREAQLTTEAVAAEVSGLQGVPLDEALERAIDRHGALQFALLSSDGRAQAVAAARAELLVPVPPDQAVLLNASVRGSVAGVEDDGEELHLRVLVRTGPLNGEVLQGLFALPAAHARLAREVEQGVHAYGQALFLRQSLKLAFALVLSFVLLLAFLLALLLALDVARRLVRPVAQLALATEAVAAGRHPQPLPEHGDDELAFLVRSFNRMVRDLDSARERERLSAGETERQRAFLETVLGRLSSGVLVIDADGLLRAANGAAESILGASLQTLRGLPLPACIVQHERLAALFELLSARLREHARDWRQEVSLDGDHAPQRLMVRGARLPDAGLVAVFDDTTELDRARRDAAWGEVARRLAHEVKNPLTPIQLAAERLRRRILPRLGGEDAEVLDRATRTVVAQVDALKSMVDAFGEYARPPSLQLQTVDLARLVGEVLDLYENEARVLLRRDFAAALPAVAADAGRLRQVLHNLLKNAVEATEPVATPRIEVALQPAEQNGRAGVRLCVADNGPGLPADFDPEWFEPYRSNKPRGSGLGLPIVRRIADEHGGALRAANRPEGGASFELWLPAIEV